jgi:hypothetical protein
MMATKRGRKADRRTLSRQPWELEHVAQKVGCSIALVRTARKTVRTRAANAAGKNRKLVEAELKRMLGK